MPKKEYMGINVIPQKNISDIHELHQWGFKDNDFAVCDHISDLALSEHPTRLSATVVGLCLKGTCILSINLKEYLVTPDTLLVLPSDQIVEVRDLSNDFSTSFFVLSPSFADDVLPRRSDLFSFLFFAKEYPCIKLGKEDVSNILDYNAFLWRKAQAKDHSFRKEITRGIILSMFFEIYGIYQKQLPHEGKPKTRKEELFGRFLREVSSCYKEERSVTFYSDRLCLTSKHLSVVVKEVSGKTASEWIDRFVILEAKALLKSTEKSVQEVAETLHFANQSFFGKYFKHHVGLSPKDYRKTK